MRRLIHCIDTLTRVFSVAISYYIFIVIGIMLYEVISRYCFNAPTIWVSEITQYLFGGCALILAGYVLQLRKHIQVDVIFEHFPPRVQACIEIISMLLIMIWGFGYMYLGWEFAYDAFIYNEKSFTILEFPLWTFKSSIFISGFFLFIQAFALWLRAIYHAVTGHELLCGE